jgi:hypothetical protein
LVNKSKFFSLHVNDVVLLISPYDPHEDAYLYDHDEDGACLYDHDEDGAYSYDHDGDDVHPYDHDDGDHGDAPFFHDGDVSYGTSSTDHHNYFQEPEALFSVQQPNATEKRDLKQSKIRLAIQAKHNPIRHHDISTQTRH